MTIYIPRRPTRDIAAEYRKKAEDQSCNVSGRDRADMTAIMTRAIIDRVGPVDGCRVLDIGCGDASLLRTFPSSAECVGTLLTKEEVTRVSSTNLPANISLQAASFDTIRNIEGRFDLIIANSCLHFALRKSAATSVISSLVEKLNRDGRLWAGELFSKRPFRRQQVFHSKRKALAYVRQQYGLRFAAEFGWHMTRRRRRADEIVECTPELWFVQPREIPDLAKAVGLEVEGIWSCVDLTGESFFAEHERFSVLLTKKPGAQVRPGQVSREERHAASPYVSSPG